MHKSRLSRASTIKEEKWPSPVPPGGWMPPQNEVEENDIDFWNDPDLLNNPEKLMKIKYTKEDLNLVSSSDFVDRMSLFTDAALQNSSTVLKMLEKHSEISSINITEASKQMNIIVEKIYEEQKNCVEIITACKNKPFWSSFEKERLNKCKNQTAKVKRWEQAIDQFSTTYEKSKYFREMQKSISPDNSDCDLDDSDGMELVSQIKGVYEELLAASKLFDEV